MKPSEVESLHAAYPVHWYAVGGIVLGCTAFLVGVSVMAYKCYRRRQIANTQNRLSAAIKKGLKESNNGSMMKSPNLRSTATVRTSVGAGSSPLLPSSSHDSERHLQSPRMSPAGSPTDANQQKQVKTADTCTQETEKKVSPVSEKLPSPEEKLESQKETAEDELKINKLGDLHFTVDYDKAKEALVVTVVRAADLPPKDQAQQSSDPYVKLQLLPEKRHKVKTRVIRKSLNPVFDEIFTFYGLSHNQLASVTLHFVVLSFDRFSRDDIIGEVVYPLSGTQVGEREMTICKEIQPRHIKIHSHGRGELLVSLCYQPAANRLTVVVLKARNLPKMDITGLSDPYVKIYLLYNGQRIAKKKTHVKKRTLNPVFNESFLFDVPCNEGLQNISLDFLVLDWDRMTKNEIIGRLEIGSNHPRFVGPESHHWNEVMNCPRKQIAEWHKLKE